MRGLASRIACIAAVVLAPCGAAIAGDPAADVPSGLPPTPAPQFLELGKIPRFTTAEQARRVCLGDVAVWADPDSGFVYPPADPRFGRVGQGTFTCRKAALAADYWDINPFAGGGDRRGRVFPINPDLLDYGA